MSESEAPALRLPLLPLRDVVVYPYMVVPLFVGRDKSVNALEQAMEESKQVVLVAQLDATVDDPSLEDLYRFGTLATILQLLKLPDGTIKVLVEGNQRVKLRELVSADAYLVADVEAQQSSTHTGGEVDALMGSVLSRFEAYVKSNKKIPAEVVGSIKGIADAGQLADTIAAQMMLDLPAKQEILEIGDDVERLEHIASLLEAEADLHRVEKKIRGRVKKQMERSQREYYLNEQMKAIQKELGDIGSEANEFDELEQKIESAGMPKEALEKANSELNKLKMMSPMSAEASVVRSYIDWLVSVPWKTKNRLASDLDKAQGILDADHFGLEDVKERILEYLAVQKRVKKVKGPVLCLVGPPGVGKTSLGESIARATNRKFTRIALGGVRDEAEIRGHRRTYIGAMPGKIIQKMCKTGAKNPLFLLDEIDKMGMDHRGDPASALLEVLDPEQNHSFNDHYLELDYDLSDVMFVCTSNSMDIPAALLDRMEVIRIPGYTEDEKVNIASRYLVPKQIKNNGLKTSEIDIPEAVLRDVIRHYTKEAGVRGLDREVAKLARKVVTKNVLAKAEDTQQLSIDQLESYLGVKKFDFGRADEQNQIGQVTGLAWTQVGGELLTIEAAWVAGKGRVTKTGSLGDVMQESIKAAMTVVQSRSKVLGIKPDFNENKDLHIHVPEGATPKDGPSAGIAMCTALVSVFTGIPVLSDVAMTGEITLRGEVLKIGGLKEKLLAAHRGGIKTVLIPQGNERDLKDIPENIKRDLHIAPVKWIEEVLELALESQPTPFSDEEYEQLELKASMTSDDKRLSTH